MVSRRAAPPSRLARKHRLSPAAPASAKRVTGVHGHSQLWGCSHQCISGLFGRNTISHTEMAGLMYGRQVESRPPELSLTRRNVKAEAATSRITHCDNATERAVDLPL
ncbi:hypothetical protein EVAR_80359_1 [Eumeta japonica]|uniref:Uncharacterized protein n=1 Tax=Eumeta variegata TaxID=151549 RepID=A0A4C1WYG3_EUMVA|nr:hypothetical protein EVAR_80359_1 [Eumeta japonica]